MCVGMDLFEFNLLGFLWVLGCVCKYFSSNLGGFWLLRFQMFLYVSFSLHPILELPLYIYWYMWWFPPLSVPLYSTRALHFVTSKDQHYYFNFHLSIIPHNLITPFFFLKMTLLGCDLYTIKLIHLKYLVTFSVLVDRCKQHHGQLSSSQKATLVSQLWSSSTSSLLPPHPQAWANH